MYLTRFTALCGPLQTIILAFLIFLIIARMEDSGSALDFSFLSSYGILQDFFVGFCFVLAFAVKV